MRLLSLLFLLTISAFAQTPPPPACDGNVATVRVSAVTATGTMEGLLKAVEAQRQWYMTHGAADHVIFATRLMVCDEAIKQQKFSDKEVMTYHVLPSVRKQDAPHDEAYEAFVKLYRDNSEIKQQYSICIPKGLMK